MPQIIGQMLMTNDSTNGDSYYTEFEPRRGAKLFVTVQVLADSGSDNIESITAQMKTKDVKDPIGSETNLGSSQSITLSDDTSFDVGQAVDGAGSDGIKEQVRLELTIKAKTTASDLPVFATVRVVDFVWSTD